MVRTKGKIVKKTDTNADMSHQNSLKYKIGELFNSLKENGIIPTIDKIVQRVYYKLKGVDFSTQNLHDLTLTGQFQDHGTALVSTSKDFFKKVFTDLELVTKKRVDKNIFLDYGSGKGGAIIHASYAGFKKSIGIEFAKELHDIAECNIKRLGLKNVDSFYQDATTYMPPLDVSIIYLFNPFDEVVMTKVAQNIASLKDKFKNEVYIIYGNPSCEVLDDYFTLLDKIEHPSGARVNYYKVT
jgi:16S rRNA G966 N2-methylase RsmD